MSTFKHVSWEEFKKYEFLGAEQEFYYVYDRLGANMEPDGHYTLRFKDGKFRRGNLAINRTYWTKEELINSKIRLFIKE